jgi:hypothetical protein
MKIPGNINSNKVCKNSFRTNRTLNLGRETLRTEIID